MSAAASSGGIHTIDGGAGGDSITGTRGDDLIDGGTEDNGNDTLFSRGGDDTIYGRAGNDVINLVKGVNPGQLTFAPALGADTIEIKLSELTYEDIIKGKKILIPSQS